MLGDRRVDHAHGAEFLQESLGHLVGALIFRDLLAHDEDVLVATHLFRHGVAQRLAHRHGDHLGAFRHVGFGCLRGLRTPRRSARRRDERLGFLDPRARFLHPLLEDRVGLGLCLARRRFAVLEGGGVLALGQDHGDRRIDRDVVGAFRHQNPAERAFIDGLDLHGRFVGFDLGDDVAGFDRIALFLVPFGEVALLHGGRERGHQNLNRHRRITRWRPSGRPARDWSPPTSPPRRASDRRGRRRAPC